MENFIRTNIKRYYFTLFIILTILIALSGVAFYQIRKTDLIREKHSELSAITDLKINQVYYWREDKVGDAEVITEDPFFISRIDFFFRTRNKSDLREINEWIDSFIDHKGYSQISILDTKLRRRGGDLSMSIPDSSFLHKVIENKKAVVSDLYMLSDSSIVMDLYVPLAYKKTAGGRDVGLLILRIDPENYLYKILKGWPNSSPTSEIVLWRKQGPDSLVYLNWVRHSPKRPFSQRFSLEDIDRPVNQAFKGKRGIVQGRDYRGVPVLADIEEVPNTSWILIAKTDLAEVYAPLRELTFFVLLIGIVLTGATAAIIGFLFRNQKAAFYKKLYDAELDRKALVKNFEFLTKYANDIILLTDDKGNISYSNEKATSLYGYSAEELRRMNIKHLDVLNSKEDIQKIFSDASDQGGLLYEAVHRKKDGTAFPVESSSRFIEVEGTVFFQSIVRDMTEKKRAEEHLYKTLKEKEVLLKEVHHRVKNNLQTINSLLNLQANTIDDDRTRRIFLDAQNRIKSMALIHQELYTVDLANINTNKYIRSLVSHLVHSFDISPDKIKITEIIEDKMISIDLAIPLGLIITEILSNTFKHAFPDSRRGNVVIELKQNENESFLRIYDDGIGFPKGFDMYNSQGLGMQLILTLTDQLDGTIEVHNDKGTEFILHYHEPTLVEI